MGFHFMLLAFWCKLVAQHNPSKRSLGVLSRTSEKDD